MCFLNRNKFANEGVINRTTLSFVGIKSTLKLAFFMWHYCRRIMVKCTHTPDLTHSQHTHTLTQTHTHTLIQTHTHTIVRCFCWPLCPPVGQPWSTPRVSEDQEVPSPQGVILQIPTIFNTVKNTLLNNLLNSVLGKHLINVWYSQVVLGVQATEMLFIAQQVFKY